MSLSCCVFVGLFAGAPVWLFVCSVMVLCCFLCTRCVCLCLLDCFLWLVDLFARVPDCLCVCVSGC